MSSAASAFGRFSIASAGCVIASTSASKCDVPGALTRTTKVLPLRNASADFRNSLTLARASALRASTTESSRSMEIASASLASAFANHSGREPGTNNLLRLKLDSVVLRESLRGLARYGSCFFRVRRKIRRRMRTPAHALSLLVRLLEHRRHAAIARDHAMFEVPPARTLH